MFLLHKMSQAIVMMQYIEYRQLSHIRPGFSETIYADLGVWDLHALRLCVFRLFRNAGE